MKKVTDQEVSDLLETNPNLTSGEYMKMNTRLLWGIYRSLNPSEPEKSAQVEAPAKPEELRAKTAPQGSKANKKLRE